MASETVNQKVSGDCQSYLIN